MSFVFEMCEVLRTNFEELFPEISETIQKCAFVGKFSGYHRLYSVRG